MNLQQKIVDEKNYIIHDITTMVVLAANIEDKYIPKEQKIIRLEKLKSKCEIAKNKLDNLFQHNHEKDIRAELKNIGKGFQAVFNHCQSVIDMLGSDEFSREERKHFREKQDYRFEKLRTLISSLIDQNAKKVENAIHKASGLNTGDSGEKTENAAEQKSEKKGGGMKVIAGRSYPEIDQVLKELGPYLKGYEKNRTKLDYPILKKQVFAIKQLPIIPIFSTPIDAEDLSTAGFDVDKIGARYLVLRDQIILGENTEMTEKMRGTTNKGKTPEEHDFLADLKESVEERLHTKLVPIGPFMYEGTYKWTWLVKENILNRLGHHGKHMNVKSWSFAFQRVSQSELERIENLDAKERETQLRKRGLATSAQEVKTNGSNS